ncbi:MAG: helix-turn-helix domain-containing protein [Halobacteriales archaeon]
MGVSGSATGTNQNGIAASSSDCDAQAVLDLLADEYAQRIIECTDRARTVGELADDCGLPRSTAYRKIDRLTDAGLLEQSVRVTATGEHPAEFRRTVAGVDITLTDGLRIDCRPPVAETG